MALRHPLTRSSRPKLPVARIAQARHDVAQLVQPLVQRRQVDRHIRVGGRERRDTLGRGDQAQKFDLLGAWAAGGSLL